jgi:PhnB protein
MPEFGISGATFIDPFGYVWMVHQVHREISYEERIRILEERRKGNK